MPQTPSYVVMRAFTSEAQREAMRQRGEQAWSHILPNSVLVAAMGNHWQPGCWQRVSDMVMATNKAGIYCGLQELQDRCLNWGDALGTMRNDGLLFAKNEGFEWICWVDNDVLPQPDTLIKLLNRNVSIIAPFVAEPGTGRLLHGPTKQPNTGLHSVKWTVLSMLLVRVNVFNSTGPKFWSDAIGADEGFHFQLLWYYGHQLYLDTDVILQTTKPPVYPLASNRLDWAEREKLWQKRRQQLDASCDRRPIDPNDPRVQDGQYMPFVEIEPKATGTDGLVKAGVLPDWGDDKW